MQLKSTPQMLTVYCAMLFYFLAFALVLWDRAAFCLDSVFHHLRPADVQSRSHRFAGFFYFLGFACAVAAFVLRWRSVDHVPLQNMSDVFLAMGMAVYPITLLCRRLGGGAEGFDMLLGIAVLFPVAFVFPSERQKLPPALQSFLFGPHVAVYLLGYVIMAKAAVHALCHFISPHHPESSQAAGTAGDGTDEVKARVISDARSNVVCAIIAPHERLGDAEFYEKVVFRLVALGFPFLTLGLLLGSWWGQLAWGRYWGWDPKEMWALATWLIYVLYFHLRHGYPDRQRVRDVVVLLGLAAVICTVLWVNLSRLFTSLHSYAS